MNIVRQTIRTAMAAALPMRMFLVDGRNRNSHSDTLPAVSRSIALTFDDGPHPRETPRLLDVMAEHGVHGTFFVVGRQAEQYPQLVRRIHDEGHALGNHTYSHSAPSWTTAAQFIAEVQRTRAILQEITGEQCDLVRPPLGKLTFSKITRLWQQRQTIVLWNVDPRDYAMQSVEQLQGWCSDYQPNEGDVVLLHDNHPYAYEAVRILTGRVETPSIRFERITDWLDPWDCSPSKTNGKSVHAH